MSFTVNFLKVVVRDRWYCISGWHPIKIWVDFTWYPSNHFSGCRLNGQMFRNSVTISMFWSLSYSNKEEKIWLVAILYFFKFMPKKISGGTLKSLLRVQIKRAHEALTCTSLDAFIISSWSYEVPIMGLWMKSCTELLPWQIFHRYMKILKMFLRLNDFSWISKHYFDDWTFVIWKYLIWKKKRLK